VCGLQKENILVYPTGLVQLSLLFIYYIKAGYVGDMLINAYFSVMSIYGWYKWSRKNSREFTNYKNQ
jgi:nicotinamide mononucleotide transporter